TRSRAPRSHVCRARAAGPGRSWRLPECRASHRRDNRHRIARFLFCGGRGLLDELHLAIDAQNLRHLLLELGVATFQVVADLTWAFSGQVVRFIGSDSKSALWLGSHSIFWTERRWGGMVKVARASRRSGQAGKTTKLVKVAR